MRRFTLAILLLCSIQANAAIDPFQKEVIDQSAHFVVGAIGGYGLAMIMPPVAAGFAVVGLAYAREVVQHGEASDGKGSVRDMFFWTMGAFVGVSIK